MHCPSAFLLFSSIWRMLIIWPVANLLARFHTNKIFCISVNLVVKIGDIQRRIFKSRREEIVGGWRKLRNEELYNL